MASPVVGSSGKSPAVCAPIFQQDRFTARRKTFALRPEVRFTDAEGKTLAFLRKKVFSWKDEIRVFTDETLSLELLNIKARKIVDWGAAFDIDDSINRQKVGVLKRSGWKSLVRSELLIADAADQEIGRITVQSMVMALLGRHRYNFEIRGQQVGTVERKPGLLTARMEVDFSSDQKRLLDRRLATAAVALLIYLEDSQSA